MTDKNIISAYDQFDSDASLETEGVWTTIGTMEFKLARAGGDNDDFVKAVTKSFKPFQVAIANDTMPKEMAVDLVVDVFVDTIIKDWKNVYGRDKQAIEFSKDAAKTLLRDLPNLFIALQAEAQKISNFRKANLEAAAGN